MKIPYYILLGLTVAACGGGSGGHSSPAGAPGKSAYEIWLEQGNTGTYQDFLDSLVSGGEEEPPAPEGPEWAENGNWTWDYMASAKVKNAYEYLQKKPHDILNTEAKQWNKHGGYTQYTARYNDTENTTNWQYIYSEKELNLSTYGVSYSYSRAYNSNYPDRGIEGYMHNKEGIGANVYTPQKDTLFSGGTLAYLYRYQEPTLIKGDAYFVYNPTNLKLELFFDNYYSFKFSRNNDGKYSVSVDGTNLTGNSNYDLQTGDFAKSNNMAIVAGYLKKDDIEEVVGTYTATFGYSFGPQPIDNSIHQGIFLNGAFGGKKL